MIDFKIGGASGTKATDKTKKTGRATATGGPSFASLLDEASAADATTAAAPLTGTTFAPIAEYSDDDSQPPSSRRQAGRLVQTLQQLAEDALSGSPTAALGKLQQYLAANPTDKSTLTPQQQQVLNEVETRAAVEAEKLKG